MPITNDDILREAEKLRKKKPNLGGAGNVPDSAMPVLAGGTGEKPGPMIQPGMLSPREREEAKRARLEVDRLANAHNAAYNDPNFKRGASPELAGIRAAQSDARLSAGAYERQARGVATQPMTAEQHAARIARLRAQEEAARAGQQAQPQGDTAFQAGQSVLPKNLLDQKFSNPVDQANHYQFVRDAGQNNLGMNAGRQAVRGASGELEGFSSPADRLRAQNEATRAEAAAKLGAPRQDYAPYDPAAAKAYVERDQQNYQQSQDSAVDARARIRESEMLARKAQVAPVEAGLAAMGATTAENQQRMNMAGAITPDMARQRVLQQMEVEKARGMIDQSKARTELVRTNADEKRATVEESLKDTGPVFQSALGNAEDIKRLVAESKGTSFIPTIGGARSTTALADALARLERDLPTLDPNQANQIRTKLLADIGSDTDITDRSIWEYNPVPLAAGNLWAWLRTGKLPTQERSREFERAQQSIGRLRNQAPAAQ